MMDVRNLTAAPDGSVTCEALIGGRWRPYSASAGDLEPWGQEVWAAIVAAGVPETDPVAAREALSGAVSAARNAAIEEGIEVGGVHVHTDDVSQARITGAAFTATRNPDYTVSWKTVEGTFIQLDAEQIFNIADVIREHVQACFDAEAAVLAQINLLSDQELQGFDAAAAYAAARG